MSIKYFVKYFIVLTIIATAFGLLSYLGAVNESRSISVKSIAIASFARFYVWGALLPLIFWLFRKFDFSSGGKITRKFFIHLGFGVVVTLAHFTIYSYLIWSLDEAFRQYYPQVTTYLKTALAGSLYLGLIFYALIGLAYREYLSRVKFAEAEKRSSLLQSELARAQLQALKMQLQPHFLFNTLNSISSLVLIDPSKAHLMIAQLGDFLRLTLDYSEDQLVTLGEEFRFLKAYLEIEQTRFADRLKISFEMADDVHHAVVPHLIMQPIVENSIKHGISKITGNGIILIKAETINDQLRLQVKDNGLHESTDSDHIESGKTGLKNVQKRLDHLYGEKGVLKIERDDLNRTTVTITIPLNLE